MPRIRTSTRVNISSPSYYLGDRLTRLRLDILQDTHVASKMPIPHHRLSLDLKRVHHLPTVKRRHALAFRTANILQKSLVVLRQVFRRHDAVHFEQTVLHSVVHVDRARVRGAPIVDCFRIESVWNVLVGARKEAVE